MNLLKAPGFISGTWTRIMSSNCRRVVIELYRRKWVESGMLLLNKLVEAVWCMYSLLNLFPLGVRKDKFKVMNVVMLDTFDLKVNWHPFSLTRTDVVLKLKLQWKNGVLLVIDWERRRTYLSSHEFFKTKVCYLPSKFIRFECGTCGPTHRDNWSMRSQSLDFNALLKTSSCFPVITT